MQEGTRVALGNLWKALDESWTDNVEAFRKGEMSIEQLRLKNARDYTDYLNAKGIVLMLDGDYTQDGVLSGERVEEYGPSGRPC